MDLLGREAKYPVGARATLAELEDDLHPLLAGLRACEPISWLPVIDGWLVTDRSTAIAVMRDSDTFTVDDRRFTTGQVVGPSMLTLEGSEHARHREPFVDPYRRGNVKALVTWMDDEAGRLVAGFAPDGTAELRTALAGPLASAVIHRSLGFVGTTPETMLGWYRAIAGAVSALSAGDSIGPEASAAMVEIRSAVLATVSASDDSMLKRLAGGSLDNNELAQNAAILMFGAIETAEGMTSNALYHLLMHPGDLAVVRADRGLLPSAVEESLRLEPAASVVDRYATVDTCLQGANVAAGELVRISLAAANRDPATFTDPDRYDIARPQARQQIAFAQGPHACIGTHLARLETASAVNAVLDLLPDITLDTALTTAPRGLIFRKPPAVVASWSRVSPVSPGFPEIL